MDLFTNLLHYYACDESSSPIVSTLGSSNKSGTLTGNTHFDTADIMGNCLVFPGYSEGGYGGCSCAAPSGLANATAATYSFLLALLHSNDYNYGMYSSLYEGDVNYRFECHGGPAGNTTDIWCIVGNGSNSYGVATDVLDIGYVALVTVVFDGTQTGNANRLKLYVSGNLQTLSFTGTIPSSLPNLTTYGVNFGRRFDTSAPGFQQMNEIGIWNRALTSSEVSFLSAFYGYNVASFGPVTPLITTSNASPLAVNPSVSTSVGLIEGWCGIDQPATIDDFNVWTLSGPDAASFNLTPATLVSIGLETNGVIPPGTYSITLNLASPVGSTSKNFTVDVTGGVLNQNRCNLLYGGH